MSAYFDESAMRKVAERTWEQIHPNIGSAVEVKKVYVPGDLLCVSSSWLRIHF